MIVNRRIWIERANRAGAAECSSPTRPNAVYLPVHTEVLNMTLASLLAYIDPGSGTLLLQAVLAAGLGSLVCLRGWIGRLLGTLAGRCAAGSRHEE